MDTVHASVWNLFVTRYYDLLFCVHYMTGGSSMKCVELFCLPQPFHHELSFHKKTEEIMLFVLAKWHWSFHKSSMKIQTKKKQGIWQDVAVRIRIIHLLPHPSGIFLRKTRKFLHISKRATAYHPQKQNSDKTDHFEEIIHPSCFPSTWINV